jgi:hypothetical protein
MENTAVSDNLGGGLHLICDAHLAATHLTNARNSGPGLHLDLPPDCQGFAGEPLPSTAVLTNTILAGHAVGVVLRPVPASYLHNLCRRHEEVVLYTRS